MKAIISVSADLLLSGCGRHAVSPERSSSEEATTETQHTGLQATIEPGRPDRSFAGLVLPHHRAAIDMAEAKLRFGKDPELRALATEIIAHQQREVAQLEAWLAKPGAQAGKQ